MRKHYSQPNGFVGRNICYKIIYDGITYGFIVSGSATKYLIGRNKKLKNIELRNIVNNTFYHVEPYKNKYPCRNFTTRVVQKWREITIKDWKYKYGDDVLGFETLVELPRTGELYKRDNWVEVGITKGFTCKRISGTSTDSWSGKRKWDIINLRPKRVFVRREINQKLLHKNPIHIAHKVDWEVLVS